jgi:hypothetical protein
MIDGHTPSNLITGFMDANGRLHFFFVAFSANSWKNGTAASFWQSAFSGA